MNTARQHALLRMKLQGLVQMHQILYNETTQGTSLPEIVLIVERYLGFYVKLNPKYVIVFGS